MTEIFTFLDKRDFTQLSRSSAIRNVPSHEPNRELGALFALGLFLDEHDHGLEPQLIHVDPDADRLLIVRTEEQMHERIGALINATEFSPEDVVVSAVKHMIADDMRVLQNETAIEIAEVEQQRAWFEQEFRDITGED